MKAQPEPKRPKVLLVDDDEMVLSILEAQLAPFCDCVALSDSRLAMDRLAAEEFDVIVSDQVMPYLTGDQLLAKVAQQFPEVERLMITGYADLGSVVKAVNCGRICHYLGKPWKGEELAEAVRAAFLRSSGQRRQRQAYEDACSERKQALQALEQGWEFIKEASLIPKRAGLRAKSQSRRT
jgi:DNA-binding NtrC family response regulator